MTITVLGSGTSHGVPVVGCACPVCRSTDPRDQRTRASVYVRGDDGEALVIDTGPEFRLQAVRAGVTRLDAVFLTHSHADHLHGLDDVRPLSRRAPLPIYGNRRAIADMTTRFAYAFEDKIPGGSERPRLAPVVVDGPARVGGLTVTPVPVSHGSLDILGWRVETAGRPGFFLYLTDTTAIPEASLALARGPALLIIDGLRAAPHNWHFSFDQALGAALALRAHQTFLTHICHEHAHREIEDYCRAFRDKAGPGAGPMAPAWDGMEARL